MTKRKKKTNDEPQPGDWYAEICDYDEDEAMIRVRGEMGCPCTDDPGYARMICDAVNYCRHNVPEFMAKHGDCFKGWGP